MKQAIKEEVYNYSNEFVDDYEYWDKQPQFKLSNFSNYVIYPKQGLIWSIISNKFIGCKDKNGYWNIALYGDNGEILNSKIHRVIWVAVNGEIPKGYEVNHIDENPSNNCIDNLNLLTHQENMNWGTRNERIGKALKGKKQPNISNSLKGKFINRNDSSKQVGAFKNGELIMIFPSTQEAQRQGFNGGNIRSCCNGIRQMHKGYQWRYLN